MRKLGISLVFVSTLAGTLALWPAGCSPGVPVVRENHSAPGALSAGASKSPIVLLPHPAFAYAQAGGQQKAVSIADVAEKALPSVVNVSSTRVTRSPMKQFFDDPMFRHFFGPGGPPMPRHRREHGLGSGVIVSADGVVLTNNHVVENAEDLEVTTADDREYRAKVVGTDPRSDLAVLKLEGDVKDLKPITIGDSARLRLGDVVLAIGNPFGVGQTVTMGIVSAKGRANVGIVDYEDFIQTDAAINPGNSGGALVDMEGNLVGVNTAILSRTGGSMGVGFAIPSEMARPIMDSLLKNGKVVRGWLGIGIQDVTPDLQRGLGLASSDGVLVSDVEPGGPAEKAGLRRGDVILKIDGQRVDSTGKLRNLIAAGGAGKKVSVEFQRDARTQSIDVTLGELPSKELAERAPDAREHQSLEGIELEPLGERQRRRFRIPSSVDSGVVVTDVDPGGAAAEAGLRPGDVILEANRRKVTGLAELERAAKAAKGKLLLLVQRGKRTHYVVLDE
jgi:serine protease Do